MFFSFSRRRFVSLASLAAIYALKPSLLSAENELPRCLDGTEISGAWKADWSPYRIRLQLADSPPQEERPRFILREGTQLFHIDDKKRVRRMHSAEALMLQVVFERKNEFTVILKNVPRALRVGDTLYSAKGNASGELIGIWKKPDNGLPSGFVEAKVRFSRGGSVISHKVPLTSDNLQFDLDREGFLQFFIGGREPLLIEYVIDHQVIIQKYYHVNGLLDAYSNAFGKHLEQKDLLNTNKCDYDCFLTTAACGALRLDDTCWELTELRRFRDTYLAKTKEGLHAIAEYYTIAPRIVAQINQTEGALYHYYRIYWQYIVPCAILSFLRREKLCLKLYRNMVFELQEKFIPQSMTTGDADRFLRLPIRDFLT